MIGGRTGAIGDGQVRDLTTALRRVSAAWVGAVLCTGAAAGAQPSVRVELHPGAALPTAAVQLRNLLDDRSFIGAMESGFPLHLEYQIELRKTRSGWFDQTVSEATVEFVAIYDPVRERFVVEDASETEYLNDEAELSRRLQRVYLVQLDPPESGSFYYRATVNARTLSDEDVDEVFDWLRGDDDSGEVRGRGIFTRAARKLLVQVAALPSVTLSARTPEFDSR